jgi:hypothetical protein
MAIQCCALWSPGEFRNIPAAEEPVLSEAEGISVFAVVERQPIPRALSETERTHPISREPEAENWCTLPRNETQEAA